MDKSICQQLSDDLFPDMGDILEDTEDYYPLGCHLYEGVEVMFNDGSEGGGRYYDRMGVCIAGKHNRFYGYIKTNRKNELMI